VQGYIYSARVPAARPAEAFVPRIVPHHPEAIVPLEAAWIRWRD
jgi:starch phosphorylase